MSLAASSDPLAQALPPRHILIVDDVEGNRAILCRRLEKFGYRLSMAESGVQALLQLAQTLPDLVLLDYMMPHMNGVEVLQALRRDARTRDLPVIMVTARTEGEAIVQALEAGADDYVTKPIDFDILKARIETQFSKTQSNSDLRRANAVLDERVSMRVLALSEIQEELEQETRRRMELEDILRARGTLPPSGLEELQMTLYAVDKAIASQMEAAAAGRGINIAILMRARTQIATALTSLETPDRGQNPANSPLAFDEDQLI